MGDTEGRPGVRDGDLRSEPARPEQRHFIVQQLTRSHIPVAARKIDSDKVRVTKMHRRTVNVRKSRGDLNRTNRVRRQERPHRHNELGVKRARRLGVDVRLVNAGHFIPVQETKRKPGLDERVLEREGAPHCEGDEIIPPETGDVMNLVDQDAIPEDVISRHIRTNIDVLAELDRKSVV